MAIASLPIETLLAKVFKPYIKKRPEGECIVEFPLSELDKIVQKIIRTFWEE